MGNKANNPVSVKDREEKPAYVGPMVLSKSSTA